MLNNLVSPLLFSKQGDDKCEASQETVTVEHVTEQLKHLSQLVKENMDESTWNQAKGGFESILFLTPPKLNGSGHPSQSPLIEITDNVNTLLTQNDDTKEILLDKDLLRLLNGTPQEQKQILGIKQFIPKKSGRNISQSFKEVESVPAFVPENAEFKQDWTWNKPRKKSNQFCFPDGGWVCSSCQNYNFCGRVKCNRCTTAKTDEDFEGKPHHIIRKELKSALAA